RHADVRGLSGRPRSRRRSGISFEGGVRGRRAPAARRLEGHRQGVRRQDQSVRACIPATACSVASATWTMSTIGIAGIAPAGAPTPLAPLREELTLHAGPRADDGAPTWTLHDPAANRFFRIGWAEFEMLSRWDVKDAQAIAARITHETALTISAEEVEAFAKF